MNAPESFHLPCRLLVALGPLLLACSSSSPASPSAGGAAAAAGASLGGGGLAGSGASGGRGANGGAPTQAGAASGAAPNLGGTGGQVAAGGSSGGLSGMTGGTSATGGSAQGGTTGGSAGGAGGPVAGGPNQAGTGGTGGGSSMAPCDAGATVAAMKLGWNLGNSLDSVDTTKSDTEVETAWGNPAITAALMGAVAKAGFGAVRIPVSWIGRFGGAPDYAISAPFMKRVEEVVNYALDENLYVIINLHHDGGTGVTGQWIKLVDGSNQVTQANTDAVRAQFEKMWAQVAEHFKSYGDHLIFESMNEIKVDYNTPLPAYYDGINGLNQAFVDTVRAAAGYSPNRCLVVPGYNTNIDYTVAGFKKPTDTSSGKLILSDHFYDPWSFAGEGSTHAWGTGNAGIDNWGQEDWVESEVAKLKSSFIDQGLPMIWGEYGAVNQTGYENYRRYYMEVVTKVVHDAGIVPFLWDTGSKSSGGEAFGLIDRSDNSVLYPDVLAAMVRAVTSSYALADIAKP